MLRFISDNYPKGQQCSVNLRAHAGCAALEKEVGAVDQYTHSAYMISSPEGGAAERERRGGNNRKGEMEVRWGGQRGIPKPVVAHGCIFTTSCERAPRLHKSPADAPPLTARGNKARRLASAC